MSEISLVVYPYPGGLVKEDYLVIWDNFSYFSIKTYVVGTQKCLTEALLMSIHNICFYGELEKIIPELSPNTPS